MEQQAISLFGCHSFSGLDRLVNRFQIVQCLQVLDKTRKTIKGKRPVMNIKLPLPFFPCSEHIP